jgi:hypothetical protein
MVRATSGCRFRAEPGEGLLDHDALGVREERVGLGRRVLVAGDQPDRHLATQCD